MAKKQIVARNVVVRQKGYLYFVTAEGHVGRTKMARGGKKKKKKSSKKRK